MKKLTLFIALLTLIFQGVKAQNQTPLKHYALGGALNFVIENNTKLLANSRQPTFISSSKKIAIVPYFGKQINPSLMLGVQFHYGLEASESYIVSYTPSLVYIPSSNLSTTHPIITFTPSVETARRQSNQIGIGIFSRHVFIPKKRLNIFVQPYIQYNLLHSKQESFSYIDIELKQNYIDLGINAGVLYPISKRIVATLRVGGVNYINGKYKVRYSNYKGSFSDFKTNFNLSNIFLGIEIKL